MFKTSLNESYTENSIPINSNYPPPEEQFTSKSVIQTPAVEPKKLKLTPVKKRKKYCSHCETELTSNEVVWGLSLCLPCKSRAVNRI